MRVITLLPQFEHVLNGSAFMRLVDVFPSGSCLAEELVAELAMACGVGLVGRRWQGSNGLALTLLSTQRKPSREGLLGRKRSTPIDKP
jgi:hypothetical protein